MFHRMVAGGFQKDIYDYDEFIRALWDGNIKNMNLFMNRITMETFRYFDTGSDPSREEPERFYHGFVLGLLVTLRKNMCLLPTERAVLIAKGIKKEKIRKYGFAFRGKEVLIG